MFPHLYSSLDLSSIVKEFEISLGDNGSHILIISKGDTLSETPKSSPII